jgi:hypothetical protein
MMTLSLDDVPPTAFSRLIETVKDHGVELFHSKVGTESLGTFRSVAGAGTFVYDGKILTVTITRDNGHFSNLMIKGGLKQLVSEAREVRKIASS